VERARVSARLTPSFRKPALVSRQLSAHTASSSLSSARPSHGTGLLRTMPE
jgi:hypothetical protein